MNAASTSAIEVSEVAQPSRSLAVRQVIRDFWTLTKPEVNFLIVIATFTGFYLGTASQGGPFHYDRLFHTLVGTLLVASGAGVLNQFLEYRFDARMRRTSRRPLAAGRLRPSTGFWFGISPSAFGATYLLLAVNPLACLFALATLGIYLLVYTPLKRRTPLATLVGAFPGAMPPLIGWAAASGTLTLQAWTLYALLFLWQFPHFMAIAWMYREDYDRAGYLVLPQDGSARARFVNCQTLLPLLALAPLSLVPGWVGASRTYYWIGALFLCLGFLYYGTQFVLHKSSSAARQLLAASIIYLPLLFLLIVFPRG